MQAPRPWTSEEVEALTSAPPSVSFADLAERLGRTRCMIASKFARLNISRAVDAQGNAAPRPPRLVAPCPPKPRLVAPCPPKPRLVAPRPPKPRIAARPVVEPDIVDPATLPATAIRVWQLEHGRCYFPLWSEYPGVDDAYYCGAWTPNGGKDVYCAVHHKVMFVPPQPRKRK